MGANKWQQSRFGAGQVKPSYVPRPDTRECIEGVQLAQNARILQDGSLTQSFGTDVVKILSDAGNSYPHKIIPYVVGDEEYMILVWLKTVVAEPRARISIYGKTDGVWDTAPLPGWYYLPTSKLLPLVGFSGDHYSPTQTAKTDFPIYSYTPADVELLSHVQVADRVFILSENHPPFMVRKGAVKGPEIFGDHRFWDVRAWPYSEDGGGRLRSSFQDLNVTVTGEQSPQPNSTNFAILNCDRPFFLRRWFSDFQDPEVFPVPTDAELDREFRDVNGAVLPLGAIFRVGAISNDFLPNQTLRNSVGNFVTAQEWRSPTDVKCRTVAGYADMTQEYSFGEFAGPWVRSYEGSSDSPRRFNGIIIPELETSPFNDPFFNSDGLITQEPVWVYKNSANLTEERNYGSSGDLLPSDVGKVLVIDKLNPNPIGSSTAPQATLVQQAFQAYSNGPGNRLFFLYVEEYESGSSPTGLEDGPRFKLRNIGLNIKRGDMPYTPSSGTDERFNEYSGEVWSLESPEEHISLQSVDKKYQVGGLDKIYTESPAPWPDGHESVYEDSRYSDRYDHSLGLGGPVYLGKHGCFRLTDRVGEINQWTGSWQRKPHSIGTIRGWGIGPSRATGFPSVGAEHQGRLVLSGYKDPGAALTISATGSPLSMDPNDWIGRDDAPISIIMSEARGQRVRVLESFETLFVSTDYGEWNLEGLPLTPSTTSLTKISSYGSSACGAVRMGSVVLWVGSDGKSVYETRRDRDRLGYISEDILQRTSVLSPGDRVVQVVQSHGKDSMVFARTANGELLYYINMPEYEVKGWTKALLPEGHKLSDLMVIRDDDSAPSQSVYGTIVSTDGGYPAIEKFSSATIGYRKSSALDWSIIEGEADLSYAGKTVEVWVDGVWRGRSEVGLDARFSLTEFNLTSRPDTLEISYPHPMSITAHICPMVLSTGPTAAKKTNIRLVNAFLEDSYGGKCGDARILPLTPAQTPAFTGWKPIPGSGKVVGLFPTIEFTTTHPLPFKLVSMVVDGTMQSS